MHVLPTLLASPSRQSSVFVLLVQSSPVRLAKMAKSGPTVVVLVLNDVILHPLRFVTMFVWLDVSVRRGKYWMQVVIVFNWVYALLFPQWSVTESVE